VYAPNAPPPLPKGLNVFMLILAYLLRTLYWYNTLCTKLMSVTLPQFHIIYPTMSNMVYKVKVSHSHIWAAILSQIIVYTNRLCIQSNDYLWTKLIITITVHYAWCEWFVHVRNCTVLIGYARHQGFLIFYIQLCVIVPMKTVGFYISKNKSVFSLCNCIRSQWNVTTDVYNTPVRQLATLAVVTEFTKRTGCRV